MSDSAARGARDGPAASRSSRADDNIGDIRDRLRQVQEALRDMPPHSGSGTRVALHDEVMRLERRLAEQRAGPDGS